MADSVQRRNRSQEHHDRAYDIQYEGGVRGLVIWSVCGAVACTAAHFTWPGFRRQTLALKAFLTSSDPIIEHARSKSSSRYTLTSAGVAGLVIGADSHLLKYEAATRRKENDLRRLARNELAKEGIIASEGEIRKWRVVYDQRMAELQKASSESTSS